METITDLDDQWDLKHFLVNRNKTEKNKKVLRDCLNDHQSNYSELLQSSRSVSIGIRLLRAIADEVLKNLNDPNLTISSFSKSNSL